VQACSELNDRRCLRIPVTIFENVIVTNEGNEYVKTVMLHPKNSMKPFSDIVKIKSTSNPFSILLAMRNKLS